MLRRWTKRTLDFAMKALRLLGRLLLCVASLLKESFDFWFGEEKPIIYKAGEGYPEVEILPRGGVYVSWEAVRRSPKAMANIRALQRAVQQCIREQEEVGDKVVFTLGKIIFPVCQGADEGTGVARLCRADFGCGPTTRFRGGRAKCRCIIPPD